MTEYDYLSLKSREDHVRLIDVVLEGQGGVPKTIVERAAAKKKAAARHARRMRDGELAYDEVWCVFDVDAHPNLQEAVIQARDNGIKLAISSPCFELWLLLHFRDHRSHEERHEIQKRCCACVSGYSKRIPEKIYRLLEGCYAEAVGRALALEAWHITRGTEGSNPSTQVHRLTERLTELGRRQQLELITRRRSLCLIRFGGRFSYAA